MQSQSATTPTAPPAPQAVPAAAPSPVTAQGTSFPVSPSPADVYQGFRAKRSELRQQLDRLEGTREEISDQLREPMVRGADRLGLEARIAEIDARISVLEKEIATADLQVAQSAGIPGAIQQPRPPVRSGPPEEFYALTGVFMVLVVFVVAYARRLWRRGAAAVSELPAELGERFSRMEQAIDAIAVEVERVGEGQRFVTRMFDGGPGHRELGAGTAAAQPIEVRAREAEPYRR